MTQILNVPPVIQVNGTSRIFTLVDDVNDYDNVITAGYLSIQQTLGHSFVETDFIIVCYVGGQGVFNPSIDDNGIITLQPAFAFSTQQDLIKARSLSPTPINSHLNTFGQANYYAEIDSNDSSFYENAGTGSGSAGNSTHCAAQKVLACFINGAAAYIPVFTQNT